MSDNMPDAESTSAALARVTAERDQANELCDKIAAELRLVTRERDSLARRCALRFAERNAANEERDDALALVASVARSNWIVARDGGRECVRCDQEITRGEAYYLQPGVDELWHVHCSDLVQSAEVVVAYNAWRCLACGQQYIDSRPHGHSAFCNQPLTPVRVTVTHRQDPKGRRDD